MSNLLKQFELARSKGKRHLITFRKNLYQSQMKNPKHDKAILLMEINKEVRA